MDLDLGKGKKEPRERIRDQGMERKKLKIEKLKDTKDKKNKGLFFKMGPPRGQDPTHQEGTPPGRKQ